MWYGHGLISTGAYPALLRGPFMAKAFDLQTSPGHLLRRAQQYANDLYVQDISQSQSISL